MNSTANSTKRSISCYQSCILTDTSMSFMQSEDCNSEKRCTFVDNVDSMFHYRRIYSRVRGLESNKCDWHCSAYVCASADRFDWFVLTKRKKTTNTNTCQSLVCFHFRIICHSRPIVLFKTSNSSELSCMVAHEHVYACMCVRYCGVNMGQI